MVQLINKLPLNKWEKQIRLTGESLTHRWWLLRHSLRAYLRNMKQRIMLHPDWIEMKQFGGETFRDWPRSILAPVAGSLLITGIAGHFLHNLLH